MIALLTVASVCSVECRANFRCCEKTLSFFLMPSFSLSLKHSLSASLSLLECVWTLFGSLWGRFIIHPKLYFICRKNRTLKAAGECLKNQLVLCPPTRYNTGFSMREPWPIIRTLTFIWFSIWLRKGTKWTCRDALKRPGFMVWRES